MNTESIDPLTQQLRTAPQNAPTKTSETFRRQTQLAIREQATQVSSASRGLPIGGILAIVTALSTAAVILLIAFAADQYPAATQEGNFAGNPANQPTDQPPSTSRQAAPLPIATTLRNTAAIPAGVTRYRDEGQRLANDFARARDFLAAQMQVSAPVREGDS